MFSASFRRVVFAVPRCTRQLTGESGSSLSKASYYQANRDTVLTRQKQYYLANKEKILQRLKAQRDKAAAASKAKVKAGLEQPSISPETWSASLKKDDELFLEYGKLPSVEQFRRMFEEEQAQDIVVLDLEKLGRSDLGKHAIVLTGHSARHIQRMAQYICKLVRELNPVGVAPRVFGRSENDWVILHTGNIVVHLFTEKSRAAYDLEGLWMNRPLSFSHGAEASSISPFRVDH
eukprot:GILK01007427.1.p1 GENE.GILK01007427.1~~GILK01007427.1.p1  ORF type:complete len:234 (-),score=39.90 GILK01007427.1:145-846(-)